MTSFQKGTSKCWKKDFHFSLQILIEAYNQFSITNVKLIFLPIRITPVKT